MAVTVALCVDMEPAVEAENAADVALAGTVTDDGTVRAVVELESATDAPLAPAGLARVTEQLACAFGPRDVGVHCKVEIKGGATNENEAVCDEPASVAARCAV